MPILNLRQPTILETSSAMASRSGQRPDHESTRRAVPITNTVGSAVGNSPVRGQSSAIGSRTIATLRQVAPTRPAGVVSRPGGLPIQPTSGLELAKHRPSSPVAEGAAYGIVVQKQGLPDISRSADVAVGLSASGDFGDRAARSGEAVALNTDFGAHKEPAPPSADIAQPMTTATEHDNVVSPTSNTVLRKTAATIPTNSLPGMFGASALRKGDDAGRVPHPFYNRPLGLRLIRRLVEAASSDNTGRNATATRHANPASLEPGTVLRKTVSTSGSDASRGMFRDIVPRLGDSGRVTSATGLDNPAFPEPGTVLRKAVSTSGTDSSPGMFQSYGYRMGGNSGRLPHPFLGVPLSLGGIRKPADPVAVMRNLFRETNFGKPSPNRLPVVAADITSGSPAQEAYSTSARSRIDAPTGVLHRPRPVIGLPVFQPAVAPMERTLSRLSTSQPVNVMSARRRQVSGPFAAGLPWISPAAFGAGAVQFSHRDYSDNIVNRLSARGPRLQRTEAPVPAPAGPDGSAAEVSPPEAGPDTSPSRIDLDAVVEKTWEKIMRKLEIERERRGQTSWHFRS